ncbi:MAG TPA: ion channel [Rhodanobacteraceae bacterium]|jgi:inward rectifier potassium channel|nr:ion channel [Rhodanobacteraceae bacterium]
MTRKTSPRRRKGVTVNLGRTEVTQLGVTRFDWHDVYHIIMSLSWPQFFAGAVTVYLLVNLLFACVYFLGSHAVNNATSFTDYFFFSVETLATVGYGAMSPGTFYGHCVATAEIVTGMMSMAVITSLVFARFSKPTARILFSRVAVITPYDGMPTLIFRVANQRRSYILEATASIVLIRDEETAEGHSLRRFYDLKLQRARSPVFALSWQIMHRIDETSPLYGLTAEAIKEGDMRLGITISGVDETFAAGITARYNYGHEEILFGRRFVDIFTEGDHPDHLYIHMDRFHELQPDIPG